MNIILKWKVTTDGPAAIPSHMILNDMSSEKGSLYVRRERSAS